MEFEEVCAYINSKIETWVLEKTIEEVAQRIILVSWDNLLKCYDCEDYWNLIFLSRCVTWKSGFWSDPNSWKTPPWLLKVIDYIWDWEKPYMKFVWRKPTDVILPPLKWEIMPWMYGRILQLDWLERKNSNTKERFIYIHGNAHWWYWDTDEMKRTPWCIWLQVDEMVKLFNLVKDKSTYIYIDW